jgi:hypothetical protein
MEDIPPRDVRYEGKIVVPSLMLCDSETLKYAMVNYNSFIDNRNNIVYMTELVNFRYNSLTDNPYRYPKSFSYGIDSEVALKTSRILLTDFFNEYLQDDSCFYKKNMNLENLKIENHNK